MANALPNSFQSLLLVFRAANVPVSKDKKKRAGVAGSLSSEH